MDKAKLKKLLIVFVIVFMILGVYVLVEYGVFRSNIKSGKQDSTKVKQLK